MGILDMSATVDYFDSQSDGWTERYSRDGHFRARLETVLGWFNDEPRRLKLLDYGCGSGVLVAALARAGHFVTGVDVSAGMIASSRRTLETAGVPAERFRLEQVGDDFHGDYLNRRYDGIISLGVIEYLDRPLDLLELLVERLDPLGRLILSFPNRSSLLRKVERLVFKNPTPFKRLGLFSHLTAADSYLNFQKHQFTIGEIQRFLAQGGLECKHVHYHVAPGLPDAWSRNAALGMTVIAEFRRYKV